METIPMISEDLAAFREKLDELSRRIDARKREFEKNGEFSDIHETLISEIRQREDKLRRKVDAVAREGTNWDLVRSEFIRDHRSIYDDLLQIGERLDADAMKKRNSTEE
jgi:predicted  nucleic acid-binding Zn-ribbon protein